MLGVFLETEIIIVRQLGTLFRNRKYNGPSFWNSF